MPSAPATPDTLDILDAETSEDGASPELEGSEAPVGTPAGEATAPETAAPDDSEAGQ